ncbi:MAG: hypothetical protein ACLQBA_14180 [Candidatus Binataceae bacterium]
MAAYLDSNVFDHLYKKIGCTSTDIANLRKKIYGRELSLLLSIHTLEEILLDRRARPELMVAKTKLTLSLGNFRRMVKPCDQLLTDDIRSHAATGAAARPFIDTDLQNVMTDGIAELVESDGEELDEEMIAALDNAKRRKEGFRAAMKEQLEFIRELAKSAGGVSFDQYFEAGAELFVKKLAERQGVLDECQRRGFDELLHIRSVRMMVGASLSFLYAWTFERQSRNLGDSIDLLHAVSAAAVAETFVTDDAQLRRLLERVPLDNFAVVDLSTFLKTIE